MNFRENIEKKISFDFLGTKVKKSFASMDGINKIDRDAASLALKMCGYSHIKKRDLELYHLKNDDLIEVIVLDEGFGRYLSTPDDVAMRKAPTIKEMISFKNAKRILSDGDVLKSRKEDTLDHLRSLFINSLGFEPKADDLDKLYSDSLIQLDALAYKDFLKTLIVILELLDFKFFPSWSKKLKAHVFGEYSDIDGESFLSSLIIFDENMGNLSLYKDKIKEKDLKKYLKDIINEDKKTTFDKKDALIDLKGMVNDKGGYDPFNNNLFSMGVPEKLNGDWPNI